MPIYNLTTYKSWDGRDRDSAWANTYQINSDVPLVDPSWQTMVEAMAQMEKILSLQSVNFLAAVVSTAQKEPEYDPFSLRTWELTGVGNRAIPAGERPVDLNLALKLTKNVGVGRAGALYLRGALTSDDVGIGNDGQTRLLPEAIGQANVNLAMGQYNGIKAQFQWVMIPKKQIGNGQNNTIRVVNDLKLSGVTLLKMDHRYFDKGNAAP